VKTGGRLIKHARYYWLLLAEGHLTDADLWTRAFSGIEIEPIPSYLYHSWSDATYHWIK